MAGYLDLRMARFKDSLDSARSYLAVQGIQDLCLEIKRFRELFTIVGHGAPPFTQDPDASIFDDLLLKADALREIDVSQSITLKWLQTLDLSEYYNHLKDKELRARHSFLEAASNFPAAALAKTRLLLFSAMALEDNKLSFQKKVCRRLAKSAAGLLEMAGDIKLKGDILGEVCESAESFRFQLEAGQVCLDKEILKEDVSCPIEEVCRGLREWIDLSLTLQSVEALRLEGTRVVLSDPAAYASFLEVLRLQAKDLVEAYKQSRKPFLKVLGRLTRIS